MSFQYTPYIWPLLTSAVITMALTLYAIRHKQMRGAGFFAVSMFLATLWSFGNAMEMSGDNVVTKIFWANVQYLPYAFAPLVCLALSFKFTVKDKWMTFKTLMILAIIPTISVLLIWTNDWHGLMRKDIYLDVNGIFPVIGKTYGPWFWVHTAYSGALNFLSLFLLGRSLLSKVQLFREQALILFLSLSVIVVSNSLYVLGISPVARFDITPIFFSISGIIIALGIFKYHFLDITPIAREYVIENMDEGILVLDVWNQIIDINFAAQNLLNINPKQSMGCNIKDICNNGLDLMTLLKNPPEIPIEFTIEKDSLNYYEISWVPLTNKKNEFYGRVVVFRNITKKRLDQTQLIEHQRTLAVLEERERFSRELHDNLAQVLGYINVQSQAISEYLSNGEIALAKENLLQLIDVTRESHDDLRKYIGSMRGNISKNENLSSVLKSFLPRLEQVYGLKTELKLYDGIEADFDNPEDNLNLLRVIQEAVVNAGKHSRSCGVHISFSKTTNCLQVVVSDKGKGFNVDRARTDKNSNKFGLNSMEERIAEMGGVLKIDSGPGQGTRVSILLKKKEVDVSESSIS